MFIEQENKRGVRENKTAGLWALREGTDQYEAWRGWLILEIGKRAFTQWMTVPTQWPPTTQRGADIFAEWLSGIRDSHYAKETMPVSQTPVPRHPRPWHGEL